MILILFLISILSSINIMNSPSSKTEILDNNTSITENKRAEGLTYLTPKWDVGDYWVLVRDAEHMVIDESDDGKTIYYYHDEKKFTMIGTETLTVKGTSYDCYKLQLTGTVQAWGDGVQKIAGIKVNFHFDLEAPLSGEIWINKEDMAFVKVHIYAEGDAETNTVLGDVHQKQDITILYETPEETFGFPIQLGNIGSYSNNVHVTGIINIEGQTDGDESINEYHNVICDRDIQTQSQSITIPSDSYVSGQAYPLAGEQFTSWKIIGKDDGGTHNDGDNIDPPSGGTVTTYFSPKVGFYVKQEVRDMWTAWCGVDEYIIQSTEVLAEYSYKSELPGIVEAQGGPLPNDGITECNITVEISESDGLLDIMEVTIDLTSLEGSMTDLYDDGTNGDLNANDAVFSISSISTTVVPLKYFLPITIKDWSGNVVVETLELIVVDHRDQEPAVSIPIISPGSIKNNGEETTLITLAADDDKGIERVYVDLGPICGNQTAQMYDDGSNGDVISSDSTYSRLITASPNCSAGVKELTIYVQDTGNNIVSVITSLNIMEWNKAPTIIASGPLQMTNNGEETGLIEAEASDDENNLESVVIDLSPLGGNRNEVMFDDGTNGDLIGNDSIYSRVIIIDVNYTNTILILNITAFDISGLSASSVVIINVKSSGFAPVLRDPSVSSSIKNNGEDIVRISVSFFDADDNINWITIDLREFGIDMPQGLLLQDGKAIIEISIPEHVEPGNYNLTITAMDLDWKSSQITVELLVLDSDKFSQDDKDFDKDGIPDWWEIQYGLDPHDPEDALEDWNNDGESNLKEFNSNENPILENSGVILLDTDFDGMPDLWEKQFSLDPLNSNDAKRDENRNGISNLDEYHMGNNPIEVKLQIPKESGILENDALTEEDLDRWSTSITIIMIINGLFLLFSIILFLLERRWRKKSIEKSEKVSKEEFEKYKEELKEKIEEQNQSIRELIDLINENALAKKEVPYLVPVFKEEE